MQPGLIALIVVVILLVVTMITLLSVAAVDNSNNPSRPSTLRPCSETVNIGALIQVSDKGVVPCMYLGQTGTLYYLGQVDPAFNFVVAPWQTDPSHVCAQYCATGPTAGVCEGPIYGGKSAQENYDTCLQTLITNFSDHCFPPAPLAAKGVSEYYAYSVTEKACPLK